MGGRERLAKERVWEGGDNELHLSFNPSTVDLN